MSGTVVEITIAREEGGPLERLGSAELVAGKGIVGDRYFQPDATGALDAVTLVEEEQAAVASESLGITITARDTRRNIVTRGIALNDLVGKEFQVGTATLYGSELCEPCKYLSELAGRRAQRTRDPARPGAPRRPALRDPVRRPHQPGRQRAGSRRSRVSDVARAAPGRERATSTASSAARGAPTRSTWNAWATNPNPWSRTTGPIWRPGLLWVLDRDGAVVGLLVLEQGDGFLLIYSVADRSGPRRAKV